VTEASSAGQALRAGLWQNNPGLVQLLGLCPLLAVSNTLINALGLAIATVAVLVATNALVSATRSWHHPDLRLPAFVLVIAGFVTAVELLFRAFLFPLYGALGIFIPLIVTNCVILGRAEACASRQPLRTAVADGLGHGLGFAAVLLLLGTVREVVGQGTLLDGAEMLFGPAAADWSLRLAPGGLLLAALPPGAFLALAGLLAWRNWRTMRRPGPASHGAQPAPRGRTS